MFLRTRMGVIQFVSMLAAMGGSKDMMMTVTMLGPVWIVKNAPGAADYNRFYKAAVEKAGSTDTAAVLAALAEVSFTGPRGVNIMNKQHHAPLTMYLGQVQADGSVNVVATFKDVDPGTQCPNL